jgi:hypothetical protein
MSHDLVHLVGSLRSAAATILGVTLAVVPLALWVAWTETILLAVVAIGAASAVLLVVLAERDAAIADRSPSAHHPDARPTIADEAVAEIHRVFPLTYHHSLKPRARFLRAMEQLARRMKAPDRGVGERKLARFPHGSAQLAGALQAGALADARLRPVYHPLAARAQGVVDDDTDQPCPQSRTAHARASAALPRSSGGTA